MKLKRFISLLLVAVMIVGMCPMAFATGTEPLDSTVPPGAEENVTEDPGSKEVTEASTPAPADPANTPEDTATNGPDPTDAANTLIPSPTDETGASKPTAPTDESILQDPSQPNTEPLPPLASTGFTDNGEKQVMPFAENNGGSSGSDTGGNTGNDAVTPQPGIQGGGSLMWCAPGITMQVVYFPYGTTCDRYLSYDNVIDVLQTYKNGTTQTVYDGFSTTSNTFICELTSGRVYKVPHYNPADKTFSFRAGYKSNTGSASYTFHPAVNNCVSGPATITWYRENHTQNVTMPAMNDIEAFFQRIILGNAVGAWDKMNVCMDVNGNSLDNWDRSDPANAPTSADDVSLFARVLRYLGVDETYINNYVMGYTGQLDKNSDPNDPESDYNVLIPTIIWSYVVAESTSSSSNKTTDLAYPYYYYDESTNFPSGEHFESSNPGKNEYRFWLHGKMYTVGDMFNTSASKHGISNPKAAFDQWWKTSYEAGEGGSSPTTNAYNDAVVGCAWDISSSYACNFVFGWNHRYGGKHGLSQDRDYCVYANGSGFVNRINAEGVDNSTGTMHYFRGYWTPYGWKEPVTTEEYNVTLQKSIDATDSCIAQLQGNPLYSLAGAEYGIYQNGVLQETLITDANGYAVSTRKYEVGTVLNVRELKAPSGYRLDATEYVLTVSEGTNEFKVKDKPIFDPPFALTKIDKDTTNPQGNSSFSGAVFKWEYFSNMSWSGTAARTWYFKTDSSGQVEYSSRFLAPEYSSDSLFITSSGSNEIPLGTIRITEVKNSIGYTVIQQPLYVSIVADSSSSSGAKFVWNDASWAVLLEMANGNFGVIEPPDPQKYGSFTLQKVDADTGSSTAQGNATLAGAVFEVVNKSTNSVKIGNFAEAEPNQVCFEFTVGSDGKFSSGQIFPIGKYTIREKQAPTGMKLNLGWSETFTVTAGSGSPADVKVTCDEEVIRGGITIIKRDSALGINTDANAKLNGITYSIINNSTNSVNVNGVDYAKGAVVMTLEIQWDGTNWTASTGDNILPYGSYIIRENPMSPGSNMANAYYELNNEDQPVTVTSNGHSETVYFYNQKKAVYGSFSMEKVDAETGLPDPQGGATFEGAKFLVIYTGTGTVKIGDHEEAERNEVCYEFVLDANGMFSSGNIFPEGTYYIREDAAPTGYKLNRNWRGNFTVENDGDRTDLTYTNKLGCPDQVIRGGIKIIKYDTDMGANTDASAKLDGISYSIVNINPNPVKVGSTTYNYGAVVMTLTIRWDGTNWSASTGNTDLPYGNYRIVENPMTSGSNMANEYYMLNNIPQTASVTTDGNVVSVTFENEQIPYGSLSLEKVDKETGKPDPQGGATFEGAKFQVTYTGTGKVKIGNFAEASNGQVCYEFVLDSNGQFSSGDIFPVGSYSIKEMKAPDGYLLNEDWYQTFTITNGEDHEFTYTESKACPDQVIRGGLKITKRDKDLGPSTGAEEHLEGITFSVINNNKNAVVVSGVEYQKGETVLILEIKWNGTEWSAATDANALPYGEYIVKENPMSAGSNMANKFYLLNTNPYTIEVTTGEQVVVTCDNNRIPAASISLEKIDKETGKPDPQGGATFEGAKFQIVNTSTHSVRVNNKYAKKGEVCYEFTLDANGQFTSDAIFPVGSYSIKEIAAPAGYKLNEEWSQSFTVSNGGKFEFTYDENKACPDSVIRGGLTIIKYDKDFGVNTDKNAGLEGITFSVINANENAVKVDGVLYAKGETVLTMEIKWDGTQWSTSSASDALPYGKYTVKENPMEDSSDMANENFFLNMEPQQITISEEKEFVSITYENEFKIIPGKIVIYKVDVGGNSLAGAKFLLEWSEDGINWQPVVYSDVERPYKGSCATVGLTNGWLITDNTGVIEFENLYVGLHYRVTELEAPEGYVLLTDYAFEGMLTKSEATAELTVVNSPGFGLPTTGSVGATLHATFGAFLLASGLLCMFALLVNTVSVFYSRKAMNKAIRHTKERK